VAATEKGEHAEALLLWSPCDRQASGNVQSPRSTILYLRNVSASVLLHGKTRILLGGRPSRGRAVELRPRLVPGPGGQGPGHARIAVGAIRATRSWRRERSRVGLRRRPNRVAFLVSQRRFSRSLCENPRSTWIIDRGLGSVRDERMTGPPPRVTTGHVRTS